MNNSPASAATKAIIYLACFALLFVGLQVVQVPQLGRAAALVAALILIIAMVLLIVGLLRTDSDTFRDIGLRFDSRTPLQFLAGLGFGLAVVGAMMAALLVFTPLEIRRSTDEGLMFVLVAPFVVIFFLGLMEEIVFRSYPLFKLRQAWGIRPAVYITSVTFAFYHGLAFENLLGPGVWGLLYAWMALTTKSIALPTGFHIGLNWMQALLGMKPKYGGSIWELSIGSGSGLIGVETLGVKMQLLLLIVGILMIEKLIRKERSKS